MDFQGIYHLFENDKHWPSIPPGKNPEAVLTVF